MYDIIYIIIMESSLSVDTVETGIKRVLPVRRSSLTIEILPLDFAFHEIMCRFEYRESQCNNQA